MITVIDCPYCKGSGIREHSNCFHGALPCPDCEGTGKVKYIEKVRELTTELVFKAACWDRAKKECRDSAKFLSYVEAEEKKLLNGAFS